MVERQFALKIMCASTHKPHTMVGEVQEVAEILQQTSPKRWLPHGPLGGSTEQGACVLWVTERDGVPGST